MPRQLERKLMREADRKGLTGKRKRAYVFGTMQRMGWRPRMRRGRK